MSGEKEYLVEAVVGKRVDKGKTQYQIKWVGWDDPTWENLENCACKELIAAYNRKQREGSGKKVSSAKKSAKKSPASKKSPSKKALNKTPGVGKKRGRPAGSTSAKKKKAAVEVIDLDDESESPSPEYEVESILDERKNKGAREFLIKWKGWSAQDSTWQPEEDLAHAPSVVAAWENRKRNKKVKDQPNTPVPRSAKKSRARESGGVMREGYGRRGGDGAPVPVEHIEATYKKHGQSYYLVEWGADGEHIAGARSWESPGNFNCPRMMEEFENGGGKQLRMLKEIAGAKEVGAELCLCCQFEDNARLETVPHDEIARLYPKQLIDYYSSRVKFISKSPRK